MQLIIMNAEVEIGKNTFSILMLGHYNNKDQGLLSHQV